MDGVILGTSSGKYSEEWPAHQGWEWMPTGWKKRTQIAPHVLLAIVNTVTNVALAIAIGHGVAIAWWRRVLKGSTIEVDCYYLRSTATHSLPLAGSTSILGICIFCSGASNGRQEIQLYCPGSFNGQNRFSR
jgi:hypothetical protein